MGGPEDFPKIVKLFWEESSKAISIIHTGDTDTERYGTDRKGEFTRQAVCNPIRPNPSINELGEVRREKDAGTTAPG